MKRSIVCAPREIAGATYRAVLAFALAERLPEALLVVQPRLRLEPSARELLDRLTPWLVSCEESSSWPGTSLIDHTATVYRYRLGARLVEILSRAADGFLEWQQPALPEDLAVLRCDGMWWLATTAHERWVGFQLTVEERDRLVAAVPALAPLGESAP